MEIIKNKYVVFFFMINFILPVSAQFLPKDDAKLNYNQIYFEYPYNENAVFYNIYLAIDSSQAKSDFKNYLINTYKDKTPAARIDELQFGKKYKWYVETNLKSGEKINSDIHYFSILNTVYNDTTKYSVKQYYNKKDKIEDGLIWCDHLHCALNRKGKVVWFIPPLNSDFKEDRQIRDFRFQKNGTVTFISEPEAYHTDRDLNIIWKGPNDGKISKAKNEFYHHCFELLLNGNYMALGNEYLELERTDSKDTVSRKVELATLIEYNRFGEIVWSWKMIDHFPLDLLASNEGNAVMNPHCNSFSIDKENKFIYLGFRDISRVIKIDKVSGKIVSSYGKKLNKTDTVLNETSIFSHPHDATILSNNRLMVLNNNEVSKGKISSLEIMNLPNNTTNKIKSVFSFKFNFDTLTNGKSMKLGGAKILTNGNFLINEGVINRIIEVTKSKELLWDLMIYKKNSAAQEWSNFPQYNIDYSTSLYPYYFSINTPKILNKKLTITIFNEGDFSDTYQIDLIDENNNRIISNKQTSVVNKNNFQVHVFKIEISSQFKLKIKSMSSGIVREVHVN